jgi:hypothetical protein
MGVETRKYAGAAMRRLRRYRPLIVCPHCQHEHVEELTSIEVLRSRRLKDEQKLRRLLCPCSQWYWITAGDYKRAVEANGMGRAAA